MNILKKIFKPWIIMFIAVWAVFLLGIILVSLLAGYLTGLSSSPVGGVAISSLFGLLMLYVGLILKRELAPQKSSEFVDYRLLQSGLIMISFAVSFWIGFNCGTNRRLNHETSVTKASMPKIQLKQRVSPKNKKNNSSGPIFPMEAYS